MRVVAGRAGGMRLKCPPGDDVRPIPDMAREAIFNILQNLVDEAQALDLFAGSGTMGIEALSRGAERCVFVERSPKVRKFLEENLAHTRLDEFSDILQRDALKIAQPLLKLERTFDLVFISPPFPMYLDSRGRGKLAGMMSELASAGLLNSGAHVILQHEKKSNFVQVPQGLILDQQRQYGRNLFNFYVHEERAE
jgi:16S rRNA (guanine966-N2)-methyltransferase